jgi:Flp pilus assembly protein TadD
LREVREALSAGHQALREGDASAAELEFRRAFQLDPTNAEATTMAGQVRQDQTAGEQDAWLRQAFQRFDDLLTAGKIDEAELVFLEMQQAFPASTEIGQGLPVLERQLKMGRLLAESQQAFDQGGFGEAVRLLTVAQELDPNDERVLDFKAQAVRERDRLRQVREAISAGQRAMRQGQPEVAEQEYQRALQLDPANAQAANLLAQIQKDRWDRDRARRLQEGLIQAENLLSGKKFEEAGRILTELQQSYPDANEDVQQRFQKLNQWKADAAALAAHPAPSVTTPSRVVPPSPAATSMLWAEELRRSLQTPRPPATTTPAPASAPLPSTPIAQAPAPPTPTAYAPQVEPAPATPDATLMFGASSDPQPPAEPPDPKPPPARPRP